MIWWLQAALAADPTPVVAVGDSLGAPSTAAHAAPGGWVAVLADCLEERASGRFSVVDRARSGVALDVVRTDVGAVLDLRPGLVLVGVAAPRTGDVAAFETALTALSRDVAAKGSTTVLVGVIEAPADDPRWNDAVQHVATQVSGVVHVDLAKDWPRDGAERAALAHDGWLTDQGQARIGAAACDAVIAWKPPSTPSSTTPTH